MKLRQIGSNQTEVTLNPNIQVLFSYETPVACVHHGEVFRTDKKWSVTTSKHINRWLDGREAKIASQVFFDTLVLEAR
jgi:hypothetical protein